MRFSSLVRLVTVSATAALVLSGCSAADSVDAGKPVSGGTFVYATGDAEPDCLDPHVGGNYPQALAGGRLSSLSSPEMQMARSSPGSPPTGRSPKMA